MRRNEREVQFNVDAYTAKLIGRENVSKLEGAILEIVKNAYDADANLFCLYYSAFDECIYILDNGCGMTEGVLREHWMTIGNSPKKREFRSAGNRIQTGAKGIGRFALDRISNRCEMLTISDESRLEWCVDWEDFDGNKKISEVKAKLYDADSSLLEYALVDDWYNTGMADIIKTLDFDFTGTVLRLYNMHDDWDQKMMIKLRNHLENLLPPDVVQDFDIYFFDDYTDPEKARIISANIDSFDYKIEFEVYGDNIWIGMTRNEFDFGADEMKIIGEAEIDETELPFFHGEKKNIWLTFQEIGEQENIIGSYSGVLYFNKITTNKIDAKRFYYKDIKGRQNLTKDFGGVKLYRDHFRVRPYGEYGDNDFDWLELSARRNRSPAGLGHPTGAWRVGSEQLIGMIDISRENRNLEDAANRNGIQEGRGFEQLKRVLTAVINVFERDRQAIGRKLAAYEDAQEELPERLESIIEAYRSVLAEKPLVKPDASTSLDPEEVVEVLVSYGKRTEQEREELQAEIKMLQTLATTGIIANMFMHEIRTLTNNIGQELDSAYESIKYDHDTKAAFQNIQQAIIFKKHFASWFGVTIESIRKDKRRRKNHEINEMLTDFLDTWSDILSRNDVKLICQCDKDIVFRCFAFDIENIISNLISNSLISFDRECDKVLDKKEISLRIRKQKNGFIMYYEDSGWGLTPKYKKNPELILEAFESDKGTPDYGEEDGTGMGMWIVNKTVQEYDGHIDLSENLTSYEGFKINISFGGKYV